MLSSSLNRSQIQISRADISHFQHLQRQCDCQDWNSTSNESTKVMFQRHLSLYLPCSCSCPRFLTLFLWRGQLPDASRLLHRWMAQYHPEKYHRSRANTSNVEPRSLPRSLMESPRKMWQREAKIRLKLLFQWIPKTVDPSKLRALC